MSDVRSTFLLALFASLLLGCSGAFAVDASFECARVEPSRERSPAYGLVSGERRCEGFFRQNISGPYLEVVSLIAAGSGGGNAGTPLKLRAATRATRLVVSPLPQGVAYRVDLANTNEVVTWQARSMLDATGLRLAELGFLAHVPDAKPDGMNFAVVSIGDAADAGKTVVVIRSSVQTQEMRWRRFDAATSGNPSASWTTLEGGGVDPWGRAYIRLDTPPLGDKPALIQVEARRPGGEGLPILEFRIWPR